MLGIGLTVFANSLYHLVMPMSRHAPKTLSSVQALDALARMAIKMDKKSPINTVSQHTKVFDGAFHHKYEMAKIMSAKQKLMDILELKDNNMMKKFTAMLFAYCGDM